MSLRILVTGGAGFIGSHLCDRLLADGHDVLCADNFSTGRKANIRHLLGNPYFEVLRHDVLLPLYVDVDAVFNLACPASPVAYQRDPVMTVKTNVVGTINALGIARRMGAVMVQASTSEVYGDPEVHPQAEGYVGHVDPLGPRACYDEGKRCAETLCVEYRNQYGTDARIARLFNCYGPRMAIDDGRVVTNLVGQALRGEPLTVYGDGSQTRSFCYVDDMVEALVRLLHAPAGTMGPINLGNPEEISMRALAERVLELTGSSSPITLTPGLPNDPRRRCPDIGRARALLDWQPVVPLRDGLARVVDELRGRLA